MYVITGAGTKVGEFSVLIFSLCLQLLLSSTYVMNRWKMRPAAHTGEHMIHFVIVEKLVLLNCEKKAIYVTDGVRQHHKPNPEIYSR